MVLTSWSWVWLTFMLVFLVAPMSYGWRYRGWGPPVPTYVQRERAARGDPFQGRLPHTHITWGYGGDLVWMFLVILLFWAVMAFWWR